MELKFTASEAEARAWWVRAYYRSGPVRRDRWVESLWGGLWAMFGLLIMMRLLGDDYPQWWLYPLVFPVGVLIHFWTFRDSSVSRIQENLNKQMRGQKELELSLRIAEGRFHSTAQGVESIWSLEDLSWAGEDAEFLDLCFQGKAYICVPQSAFRSPEHKQTFLKALGVTQLRDLVADESLLAIPEAKKLRDGIAMSDLPLYVAAVGSGLLGLVVLVANSFVIGPREGLLNPLSYAAMGMLALGIALGIWLLARRR